VRVSGVLGGALLGLLILLLAWSTGLADPPEAVTRAIATFTAVFPEPMGTAVVERLPCPPLRRLRLYVVCTRGCEGTWKVIGVRGLLATTLANHARRPPEPVDDRREAVSRAVARERLRLDERSARQMIGCYLLLEGLRPDLILTGDRLERLRRAGGDEEARRRLAESLEDPDAVSRLAIHREDGGYASRFLYWHTAEPGRPVLELKLRLGEDGALRSLEARAPAFTERAD
jgi:hypothetical protein